MLLGYCPLNRERQHTTIAKKRQEYQLVVSQYFGGKGRGTLGKSDAEQALLHQVSCMGEPLMRNDLRISLTYDAEAWHPSLLGVPLCRPIVSV